MANESELDLANREFEQISPGYTPSMSDRLRQAFQVYTITPGLPNIGQRAFTAPGDAPYQTGPSVAATAISPGSSTGGEGGLPGSINLITVGGPPISGPVHPGSEPPVGPEESLRYACVDGVCLQDPNGLYYGLDECLADECGLSGGGGGDGDDSDPSIVDPPGPIQCYDRAVHCTFAAMILGVTDDSPLHPSPTCDLEGTTGSSRLNRQYWKYEWIEVEALDTERETWCTPLASGFTPRSGDEASGTWAINIYEHGVEDSGGSIAVASTTITRLPIPTFSLVTMHIDQFGQAWFCQPNPLQIECETELTLTLDGGEFNGGV